MVTPVDPNTLLGLLHPGYADRIAAEQALRSAGDLPLT